MGSFKLITLWFNPMRFATLTAAVVSVGTMGNIVSTTPLVLLVTAMGWRLVFILFAVVTLIASVFFFSVVRDKHMKRHLVLIGKAPPRGFGACLPI